MCFRCVVREQRRVQITANLDVWPSCRPQTFPGKVEQVLDPYRKTTRATRATRRTLPRLTLSGLNSAVVSEQERTRRSPLQVASAAEPKSAHSFSLMREPPWSRVPVTEYTKVSAADYSFNSESLRQNGAKVAVVAEWQRGLLLLSRLDNLAARTRSKAYGAVIQACGRSAKWALSLALLTRP